MNRVFALISALTLAACTHASTSEPTTAYEVTPTLREMYGVKPTSALDASKTALLLVDFQKEFRDGKLPVVHLDQTLERAATLRRWARSSGVHVVHVRNVVQKPNTPIFGETSPTIEIFDELTPLNDETLLTKRLAGAFSKSDLDARLRDRGITTVIVAGIMTHLAVDTTVRDAGVLGYNVIVASDACTTRSLIDPEHHVVLGAEQVHRVALASMADRFADVRSVDEISKIHITR